MRSLWSRFAQNTFIILVCTHFCLCERERPLKIGAVLDQESEDAELAIQMAVDYVNFQANYQMLKTDIEKVEADNEFAVAEKICGLLEKGMSAVFGPSSASSAIHAHSILDAKDMPHFEVRPDSHTVFRSLNIHPDARTLRSVLVDLVQIFDWKGFTIVYESGEWLPHVSELLKIYDSKGYTITARQLDLKLPMHNFRQVLRRVKLSGDTNIVIDCSVEILPEVLKQAQQVGLLTDDYNLIISCLDFHTLDLEPYRYGGTNITGIRLIDPEEARVKDITDFIKQKYEDKGEEVPEGLTPDFLRVESALLFDSVLLFAEAMQILKGKQFHPMKLKCGEPTSWKNGLTVLNTMGTSTVEGLSRMVKLDTNGNRTEFVLDLIELQSDGIQKFGTWNSSTGIAIARAPDPKISALNDGSLQNRTFIVLTALSPPYGMLKESSDKLHGNDRFEGVGIELIHELSLMLGFNYTFVLQEDGVYGSLNRMTGEWNGMIRQLLDYKADLAITDLTITSDRESAVDFTMPFMNLGISILYKKPTKEPPSLFSFMSPFSSEVWLYLGAAYLGVSVSLFILGRLSPAEWDNPFPCIEEPETLENQFSLANSCWFTIGALLQQGSEIAPKSPSTRTVASIWWFFTLIMVSSYTANLAAFLTVESVHSPINNAEELANSKIKYGAKRDGSTINFFKDAEYPVYQKMYQYMKDHPEDLTSSNTEGLERVKSKDENYAYLMESTSIEYLTERECDVTQIGGQLDEKGYGIAMRKNSPYRSALSEAVLRLQEQGKLTIMKTRWWKEKRGGGACSQKSDDGAEELDLKNVGGVFFVLCVGSTFATVFGLTEWVLTIRKRAKENEVPFKEEFVEEIRFVMRCSGNSKPVRHRKGSSSESKHSIITDAEGQSKSESPRSKSKRPSFEPFMNMRVNGNHQLGRRKNVDLDA